MRRAVLVFALPALLLAAVPAPAQDAAPADAPEAAETEAGGEPAADLQVDPLVAEGTRLRAVIDELDREIDEIRKRLDDASGEDAQVIRQLVSSKEIEALSLAAELAKNVLEQEKRGLDATELRRWLVSELATITPIVMQRVEHYSASVKELRAARETAKPEALLTLERRITEDEEQLQWLYEVAWDHVVMLEQLGMQAADEREALSRMLRARSEIIGGRLAVARRERDDLTTQLGKRPDDAELKAKVDSLEERLARDTRHLAATADILDGLGVNTAEARQLLIESTGEITTDVLDREVAVGLLSRLGTRGLEWMREGAPTALFRAFMFALIVFSFWLVSKIWARLASRALGSSRVQASTLLRGTLVAWVARAIVIVGVLVGLSQLGVQLGPLLAGLGIAGFIVGFALQDSLANFAAGTMILIYRPFDVGDVIESGSVYGTVKEMSLVNTTVLTFDNQTLIVPNNKIWGDVIRNVTAQKIRRVDLEFRVAYGENVDRVETLLREVVKAHPKVIPDPAPMVKLHKLAEWSMIFVLRPWTSRQDYWEVYWDLTRAVQRRFEEEHVRLAVPRAEVVAGGGPAEASRSS